MPGGKRDSSKTRVAPVFDQLASRQDDWVRLLVSLPAYGSDPGPLKDVDLTFTAGYWGDLERGLQPPRRLLEWLIRNLSAPVKAATINEERKRLLNHDPETIELALALLKSRNADRGWWVFEGPTYPDVVVETPEAIVVVEGKRTESGPTTSTTWIPNRHQMWRHMDAAWEIRGNRAVFGLFIVAGDSKTPGVPTRWQSAASELMSAAAISGSFPHRAPAEREAIVRGFLGITTWQQVCHQFAIDHDGLPDTLE